MRWAWAWVLGLVAAVMMGCAVPGLGDDEGVEAQKSAAAMPKATEVFALSTNDGDPKATKDRDAFWLAWLSALSYSSFETIDPELTRAGLKNAGITLFEHKPTDTQAYAITTPTHIVVAFRGTTTLADAWTDLGTTFTATPFGAVHTGFFNAFRGAWRSHAASELVVRGSHARGGEGIEAFLRARIAEDKAAGMQQRKIVFTGHSLGGALASITGAFAALGTCAPTDVNANVLLTDQQLRACLANAAPIPVQAIYTFGAPRIGDRTFAQRAGKPEWFGDRRATHRFVHGADAVPGSFTCGNTCKPHETAFHPIADDSVKAEDAFLEYLAIDNGIAVRFISDHSTSGYLTMLGRRISPSYDGSTLDRLPSGVVLDALKQYFKTDTCAGTEVDPGTISGTMRVELDARRRAHPGATLKVCRSSLLELRFDSEGTAVPLRTSYIYKPERHQYNFLVTAGIVGQGATQTWFAFDHQDKPYTLRW